jgi:ABC-type nitrate/sulfonate/bicarbonate transport system permease component
VTVRRTALHAALSIVIVAVLVVAWQMYASRSDLGADVLPTPGRVLTQGWGDRVNLWNNMIPTLRATLLGFALSLAVGFALSVLIDLSATLRGAVLPLLVVSQTLPLIAIAPLAVLWFGYGLTPKILLVALVTFFPITVGLVEGYAASDPVADGLMRSMGARRWRVFWSLRLPTSMPYFFAGLRIAITYAVAAAIFAEYAGATEGLGIYMEIAKNSFRTDLVFAAVAVTAALTLVLFAATYAVERFAVPWVRLSRKAGPRG